MSVIVNDSGFHPYIENNQVFDTPQTLSKDTRWLDLPCDFDLSTLEHDLENVEIIRIPFASFADGRGFTLARLLRTAGYNGHIRAVGHIISDQYAMARRSGFDDVEIDDELAKRQPWDQWKFRADTWKQNDYQSRLRKSA